MKKNTFGRLASVVAMATALSLPGLALGATAFAATDVPPLIEGETEMREGQDHTGPDFITQFEKRIDSYGNTYCVDQDGDLMSPAVMDENCRLDRSALAREGDVTNVQPVPPTVIETGEGYQNVTTLDTDISFEDLDLNDLIIDHPEIETGEGYENIVPLGGGLQIGTEPVTAVPISAPVNDGLSTLALTGIIAGALALLGGGTVLYLSKIRKAPASS